MQPRHYMSTMSTVPIYSDPQKIAVITNSALRLNFLQHAEKTIIFIFCAIYLYEKELAISDHTVKKLLFMYFVKTTDPIYNGYRLLLLYFYQNK